MVKCLLYNFRGISTIDAQVSCLKRVGGERRTGREEGKNVFDEKLKGIIWEEGIVTAQLMPSITKAEIPEVTVCDSSYKGQLVIRGWPINLRAHLNKKHER